MIIITRLLSQRMDALTITLYSNMIGFIVSIPFAFILDNPLRVSKNVLYWAFLIGTAIVVHGIATLIWNTNIRHVDAAKASILSNLEPFVAMVMGLLLLFKPITVTEILGSLFIVGVYYYPLITEKAYGLNSTSFQAIKRSLYRSIGFF